ncbi:MAG TPA: hypothetical protein P5233_17330, partial [Candidatus Paceibacterota bacterium]|nr:hypothetical protein [Candidatus Paceibacterota bacterium]
MKTPVRLLVGIALVALSPALQATVFFSDTFNSGSTLNSLTPAAPTPNSTSYQLSSSKSWNPTPSLTANDLKFGIGSTTGGGIEVQALFTTNPVSLSLPGDYIQLRVTFTNTAGLLTAAQAEIVTHLLDPLGLVPGYELLGHMGHGGMGVVYKARQIAFDRIVALKTVLIGTREQGTALARFEQEARSLGRLVHPHL